MTASERSFAGRLATVIALAATLLVLPAFLPPASAAPVRTVLAARIGDGAWRFLSDLAELWENRYDPTDERLALRAVTDPARRLRDVARGRGDFAVVDAATAAASLAEQPRLTALAVLWPNLLHAVSRNPRVQELALPPAAEVWVLDSAAFTQRVLLDLTRNAPAQQAQFHRVPEHMLVDALDYADTPVLLFTAPAPLAELVDAQRQDSALRVLPLSNKLVDELKLAYPWLDTQPLPRAAYPGLERNLELPALFQVLVGRRDLPSDTVRKVLDTVYRRSNAMALFDPLFGQLDGRMNAVYGKLMPFHPVTAQRFNFTPAVP